MKKLNSTEIRQRFLDFFKKNDHLIIEGSSIIPANDPTLLFINSGMAPLKKYFLGESRPPKPRLANVQPCIRTKDIDDVGDRHHLTLFEMLGSWSIGDYYKKSAVEFAYNLLVKEFEFDPTRLFVTVYKGDPQRNLPPDEESALAWENVGIPKERILQLGADNFWGPAGETGPCGPCTEVFFDFGPDFGPAYKPGQEFDTTKRYIEIWNAGVFMEFNKMADGSFSSLPLKSVDTGSGLERMCMAMNNTKTVYETDLFLPLMQTAKAIFANNNLAIESQRMLSDHMRASTLMLAEGVKPSNEGRGYIPRRLLRKCISVCVAEQVPSQNLIELVRKSIESLGPFYPILQKNQQNIEREVLTEIRDFEPTIQVGLKLLQEKLPKNKGATISGDIIFMAVATHGVPLEVVKKFAEDQQMNLDIDGYDKKFAEHQAVSRSGGKLSPESSKKPDVEQIIIKQLKSIKPTIFSGYEKLSDQSKVIFLFDENGKATDEIHKPNSVFYFVTEKTCFYGEGGGQVGDTGEGIAADSNFVITDTIKAEQIYIHVAELKSGMIKNNTDVELRVNECKRLLTRRNHSATHLLQAALKKVLGEHVLQKGSHVDSNRLRFDFQHPQAVSKEELENIEKKVNEWVWANFKTTASLKSFEEATKEGALALFSEKYGDEVRVVQFGPASIELCGGTHVEQTGEIGLFVITSESSVARGVRRIEAITSLAAYEHYKIQNSIVKSLEQSLNCKSDKIIDKFIQLKTDASQKSKATAIPNATEVKSELIPVEKLGIKVQISRLDADGSTVKAYAEKSLQKNECDLQIVLSEDADKLRVFILANSQAQKQMPANILLQKILPTIEGRGGGKTDMAQGGGNKPSDHKKFVNDLKNFF